MTQICNLLTMLHQINSLHHRWHLLLHRRENYLLRLRLLLLLLLLVLPPLSLLLLLLKYQMMPQVKTHTLAVSVSPNLKDTQPMLHRPFPSFNSHLYLHLHLRLHLLFHLRQWLQIPWTLPFPEHLFGTTFHQRHQNCPNLRKSFRKLWTESKMIRRKKELRMERLHDPYVPGKRDSRND